MKKNRLGSKTGKDLANKQDKYKIEDHMEIEDHEPCAHDKNMSGNNTKHRG